MISITHKFVDMKYTADCGHCVLRYPMLKAKFVRHYVYVN